MIRERLINQPIRHAALSKDIPPVPDTAFVVLADDLIDALLRDGQVVPNGEVLIIIAAKQCAGDLHIPVFIDILSVDLSVRVVGVQIPIDFPALGGELPVEGLFDRVVMMEVDFRRNPHPVGVAADLLEAVRLAAAGKNYDFDAGRRSDLQAFVVLVLAPFTPAPEDTLQAVSVAVADIKLRIGDGGPGGKVQLIWRGLQLIGERKGIVHRFACTDSALSNIDCCCPGAPHIFPVLFAEYKRQGF